MVTSVTITAPEALGVVRYRRQLHTPEADRIRLAADRTGSVEITVSQRIEQTRSVCEHALSDSSLMAAENLLAARGVTEQMRLGILQGVAKIHKPTAELRSLRESVLLQGGLAAEPCVFERALLLRAVMRS